MLLGVNRMFVVFLAHHFITISLSKFAYLNPDGEYQVNRIIVSLDKYLVHTNGSELEENRTQTADKDADIRPK